MPLNMAVHSYVPNSLQLVLKIPENKNFPIILRSYNSISKSRLRQKMN